MLNMIFQHHFVILFIVQGWGEFYSGTPPAENDKHEYTKKISIGVLLKYRFSSTYSYVQYSPQPCHCSLILPYGNIDLGQYWLR